MLLFILLVVTILVIIKIVRNKNEKYVKLYNKLKTNVPSYPFVGHLYLFHGDGEVRMEAFKSAGTEAIDKGGIVAAWMGHKLYTFVSDPEIAEIVVKKCIEKDYIMKFMNYLLGNGLLIAPVPIWQHRRKIMVTVMKNVPSFFEVFDRRANLMVERLKTISGPLSILETVKHCTFGTIYECVYGIDIGAKKDSGNKIIKYWDEFRDVFIGRVSNPLLHYNAIYNNMPTQSQLEEHRKLLGGIAEKEIHSALARKQQCKDRSFKTFLEMLVDTSSKAGGYSELELKEETLVITFAGGDSISVAASFALLMLAKHPEEQEKVFAEVYEIVGKTTRSFTLEDISKMKYLEAFAKETLRLYPPFPVIVREINDDVTLPSGITLVKGATSVINIYSIHRYPKYWGEDAESFRPARFLDIQMKHPAQFMPFSYGSRNCTGQRFGMLLLKTIIANMLMNFKIVSVYKKEDPIRLMFDVTMKDVNGFKVKLEPRKITT